MKTGLASLRATAMRGATSLFVASLVAKLAGLATIYVTGRVLSKSDFALYAIAIAWGEVFGFLQNGGLHRLLLQRARTFDYLYPYILGLSLIINVILFVLLTGMAPIIANVYDADRVEPLIILFALSLPAGTLAPLLRSRLMIALRFSELSVLDIYSALIRNIGVISLAVAGIGPASFILPVIAVGLFESVYLSRKRLANWRPKFPGRRLFLAITGPTLWIMLAMFAAAFVANGDYIVIGTLEAKATVGAYFFGFQLTIAVLNMFTRSLRSVYVSSFVALRGERSRQENAFVRSLEMGALLLFFVLFAVAAVSEPVVALVWEGKWDVAVPVIEIIAVASLARVVSPIARSLFEARGAWRLMATLSWIEGIGLMASAAIGASLGGLITIAAAVGVYLMLVGVLYIAIVSHYTGLSPWTVASAVFGPYAIALVSLGAGWSADVLVAPTADYFLQAIVRGGGFTFTFAILAIFFKRALIKDVLAALFG
jgi:O-antigen/teichoic acid export membrane protein